MLHKSTHNLCLVQVNNPHLFNLCFNSPTRSDSLKGHATYQKVMSALERFSVIVGMKVRVRSLVCHKSFPVFSLRSVTYPGRPRWRGGRGPGRGSRRARGCGPPCWCWAGSWAAAPRCARCSRCSRGPPRSTTRTAPR